MVGEYYFRVAEHVAFWLYTVPSHVCSTLAEIVLPRLAIATQWTRDFTALLGR